jgi:Fe-S-cluster containining protein
MLLKWCLVKKSIGLSHNCSFFHSEGRVQEVRPSLCRKYARCLLLLHSFCQPSGSASAAADGAVAAATSEEAEEDEEVDGRVHVTVPSAVFL